MNEFSPHEFTASHEKQTPRFDISANTISSDLHPEDNQDFNFKLANGFGVFDGVGGYKGGREAAMTASEIVRDFFVGLKPTSSQKEVFSALTDSFKTANKEILDNQHKWGTEEKTTGTYGFVRQENGKYLLELASVGDSRAYLFRDDHLYTLTQDHNHIRDSEEDLKQAFKVQEELDDYKGDYVLDTKRQWLFNHRNGISQCFGSKTSFPDLFTYEIKKGDILLFCTDGVSDNLTKNEIESIISKNHNQSSYEITKKIVFESLSRSRQKTVRSKPDDMTALVVYINSDPDIISTPPKTISFKTDTGLIDSGWIFSHKERASGFSVLRKTDEKGVTITVKVRQDQIIE